MPQIWISQHTAACLVHVILPPPVLPLQALVIVRPRNIWLEHNNLSFWGKHSLTELLKRI